MKEKKDSAALEKSQSAERCEQQMRKGALEMATLAALWSGRLYGLEIIRRFEDSSQLGLAEGTIYPILSRLKSEGLLASEWVEAEAGHPRKYYWLTGAVTQRPRTCLVSAPCPTGTPPSAFQAKTPEKAFWWDRICSKSG